MFRLPIRKGAAMFRFSRRKGLTNPTCLERSSNPYLEGKEQRPLCLDYLEGKEQQPLCLDYLEGKEQQPLCLITLKERSPMFRLPRRKGAAIPMFRLPKGKGLTNPTFGLPRRKGAANPFRLPRRKGAATPVHVMLEVIAVAVTRSCGGNHVADKVGLEPMASAVANPMMNWPM